MNRILGILIVLTGLMYLSGCSLKEDMRSDSTKEEYYRNEAQIRTGLNGCYASARAVFTNSGFFQMTECAADLMYQDVSSFYDANCDISPSRPGVASRVWASSYEGVMRCNAIMDAVCGAEESGYIESSSALSFKAEAAVMRALYYYLLTSTFGDVPFYTVPVTEADRDSIARLPRMSADEIRDNLIEELTAYLMPKESGGCEALPLVRSYGDLSQNYAGSALGLMLAGKFCMWNRRWEDAIKVFEVIEDIYGDFKTTPASFGSVYPLTDVPFSRKYVKESILEIGNDVQEYGIRVSGSLAQFCMPKRTVALPGEGNESAEALADASDIYDGIVIPELGEFARTTSPVRPTTYFYTQLMSYDSQDLRSGEYSQGSDKARNGSGTLAWRWAGYGVTDLQRDTLKVMWFKEVVPPSALEDKEPSEVISVQVNAGKQYGKYRPWLGNKFWCYGMNNNLDGNNYKIFRYAGVLLNMAESHLMMGDLDKACAYLNIVRIRAGLDPLTAASVGGNSDALMEEIRMECARELFGEFQRKFDLVRWGVWYDRVKAYNEGKYIHDYVQPYHEFWPIPADQVTYSGNSLDNDSYKQ